MAGARCLPTPCCEYSVSTLIMAVMPNGFWVDVWRFIAGIGIGVELVTIDTYVSEIIPRYARGRAFAFSQFVTFCAVPVVAFIASPWLLGPTNWRWVVVIGSAGALVVLVAALVAARNRRAGWLGMAESGKPARPLLARSNAR